MVRVIFIREAGGRTVPLYDPRQLGKFLRTLPGAVKQAANTRQ